MTAQISVPKRSLKHKISILPPSSWAKIDLTELFNMDDYYNPGFVQLSPDCPRHSYTAPWHSPQRGTPQSPSESSCHSSSSSIWSQSTITQQDFTSPTAPPIYCESEHFVFPDLKPPPLYLHPFYSRSQIPDDASEDGGPSTLPEVVMDCFSSLSRWEKPLPQLPQFDEDEADVEGEEEDRLLGESHVHEAEQHAGKPPCSARVKAFLRGMMRHRLVSAERESDRLLGS